MGRRPGGASRAAVPASAGTAAAMWSAAVRTGRGAAAAPVGTSNAAGREATTGEKVTCFLPSVDGRPAAAASATTEGDGGVDFFFLACNEKKETNGAMRLESERACERASARARESN